MVAFEFGHTAALPISWAVFAALFIPPVVAAATRYRPQRSRATQAVVALLLASVLAVWTLLADHVTNDTFLDGVAAFLAPITAQLVAYLAFWQPVFRINARLGPDTGL